MDANLNEKDFDYNIDYIVNSSIDESEELLKYQSKIMNSFDFNFNMYLIEYILNKLYENINILQSLIDYTKSFITQNINYTSDQCKDLINVIEAERDSIKKSEYNTITISLDDQNNQEHTDRNGSIIPSCELFNSNLILSGTNEQSINVVSVSKINGFTEYKSNLQDILLYKPYRTFYLLDGIAQDGLKEELKFTFSSPSDINFMDLITSNCTIETINLIDINNNVINIDTNNGNIQNKKDIKEIHISLLCNQYEEKQYYIDTQRMNKNFWLDLEEYEYDKAVGINTLFDLDTEAGINQNREDYNSFINDTAEYYKNFDQWQLNETNYFTNKSDIQAYNENPEVLIGNDAYVEHTKIDTTIEIPTPTVLIVDPTDAQFCNENFKGISNIIVKSTDNISTDDLNTYQQSGYNIVSVGSANNNGDLTDYISSTIKGENRVMTSITTSFISTMIKQQNGENAVPDKTYVVVNNDNYKQQVQALINENDMNQYLEIVDQNNISDGSNVLYFDTSVTTSDMGGFHVNSKDGIADIRKCINDINSMRQYFNFDNNTNQVFEK